MVGPLIFISVPTGDANTNWSVYDYGRIDEGATSGAGDGLSIEADDSDENETQTFNHEQPPAALIRPDQLKWHVRTGSTLWCSLTGNIYVNGAWQASRTFSQPDTDYTQTITGDFADFSIFQSRFLAGSIDKNEEKHIEYSTIAVFGYGTVNLQGGNLKGGNVAT